MSRNITYVGRTGEACHYCNKHEIISLHKERGIACVGARVLVGIEPRALHKLGTLSTTEPHP